MDSSLAGAIVLLAALNFIYPRRRCQNASVIFLDIVDYHVSSTEP